MKHFIYHRVYIPVLVDVLKFVLWGADWILPESIVEQAYETISDYCGQQYCLPERTAMVMAHLPIDQQELIFNEAWETRKCQRAVDDCVNKAKAETESESTAEPTAQM